MNIGAEYSLDKANLTFGLLSTTRFTPIKNISELTLSANYHPVDFFDLALSYSMIQSAGKSFGLAFRVGPLLLGTDYMYFGKSSNAANVYVGLSIPMGKKK